MVAEGSFAATGRRLRSLPFDLKALALKITRESFSGPPVWLHTAHEALVR